MYAQKNERKRKREKERAERKERKREIINTININRLRKMIRNRRAADDDLAGGLAASTSGD